MSKLSTVKGTKDLLGDEIFAYDKICEIFSNICKFLGYEKISTPILEHSDVFLKSLGVTSDIISKEMYSFTDQGGDNLVLRPEGTAAISRALITNSLQEDLVQKYFYLGPMFRRERPQSGRLRQFHQIGIEFLGKNNFLNDVEVIMIAEKLIVLLDLKKKVHLEINTLGNTSSRREYLKVLVKFLKKNESELSNESKRRLKTNPLRILDSKDPKDIKIRECAPRIFEYLDKESKDFFEKTLDGLKKLKINFILNPFLVRGLDYYNHTTFEYITNDKKSQNAILAGGRYDGLVKSLGGNDIGGVGWAAGIERIVLNAKRFEEEKNLISFFATSEKFNTNLLNLINELKLVESISVNFISSGNLKKKFSKANKLNSKGCIILGEDEWKEKNLIWKDFRSGTQEVFPADDIQNFISKIFFS